MSGSNSRVSKIRRESFMLLLVLGIEMIFLGSYNYWKSFDFKYQLQFIPYALLGIAVLMASILCIGLFRNFDVTITNDGLAAFLQKIQLCYDKNRKAESWFGAIMVVRGATTAFSFFPKKLET
jgi:hypothetical protein